MKNDIRKNSRPKTKQRIKRQHKESTQKTFIGLSEDIDQYVIHYNQIIGQGTYGKVYKTSKNNSDQLFACKFIKREKIDDLEIYYKDKKMAEELQKRLITEGQFQMQLWECPYITRMYKTEKNEKGFFFIMEYCETDLAKILKQQGYLNQDLALKYFKQTVQGIKFIYQKNAFHRDLKPQNLLLKNDNIKISDFGFVKIFDEIDHKSKSRRNRYQTQSKVGTFRYMSPDILLLLDTEMKQIQKGQNNLKQSFGSIPQSSNSMNSMNSINSQKKYQPEKSDVWSLGIILYKMLYAKQPYDGKNYDQMIKKINQNKLAFPGSIQFPPGKIVKINVSKGVIKLIKKMLIPDPNQRIQFMKLYSKLNSLLQQRQKQKQRSQVEQNQEFQKISNQQLRNKKQRLLRVFNKIIVRIYKDLSTFATLRQIGIQNYSQFSYKIMTLLHQKRKKHLQNQNEDLSIKKSKQKDNQIQEKVKQQISQYHNTFYEQIKNLSNLKQDQNLSDLLMKIYQNLYKYQDFDMLIKEVQIFLLFLLQLLCLQLGLIKQDYICATDDKTQSLKIKSIQNFKNDVMKLITDYLKGQKGERDSRQLLLVSRKMEKKSSEKNQLQKESRTRKQVSMRKQKRKKQNI